MRPGKDQTRELEICALYSGGETMQEIGSRYDVSRERVRQILARNGLGGQWHYTRVDPFMVLRMVAECSSAREIATRLGLNCGVVLRVLRELAPRVMDEMAAYRWHTRRDRELARLRALVARLGRTPTAKELQGRRSTLRAYFGGTRAALLLAGATLRKTGRPRKAVAA